MYSISTYGEQRANVARTRGLLRKTAFLQSAFLQSVLLHEQQGAIAHQELVKGFDVNNKLSDCSANSTEHALQPGFPRGWGARGKGGSRCPPGGEPPAEPARWREGVAVAAHARARCTLTVVLKLQPARLPVQLPAAGKRKEHSPRIGERGSFGFCSSDNDTFSVEVQNPPPLHTADHRIACFGALCRESPRWVGSRCTVIASSWIRRRRSGFRMDDGLSKWKKMENQQNYLNCATS
ncbi:uncharacterized protein LOC119258132 [Talpa occidentalis]|uniref:uncharacterized protein LOC119258132 n=1 Tax=Talpa occidentalis TaxID=50954 RepID=UPI00188EE0E1|nr:uncharacterized protein LOC119258132 [Talpa occidentalis]